MLKHSGSQKLIPPFFHKMPTLQKLIPQNTSFFMPQSQKYYAEWNNHFCAAHKSDFLLVNKYIFQLKKYEHKDVCESIDSDDTSLSSIGFAE